MSKMVDCVVLGRQAPALETAPWPGDLGERIVQQVSLEGWQQWLARQTMLMNEKTIRALVEAGAVKKVMLIADGATIHVDIMTQAGVVTAYSGRT